MTRDGASAASDPVIRVLNAAVAARLGAVGGIESCLRAAVDALGATGGAIATALQGAGGPERARVGAPPPGDEARWPLRAGGETVGELRLGGIGHIDDAVRDAVCAALALVVRSDQLFTGLEERARTLDRQLRQLVALQEVARAVARAGALDPLARVIAREARRMVRADSSAVLVRDVDGEARLVAEDGDGGGVVWTAGIAAVASGRVHRLPGPQAAVPVQGHHGLPMAAIAVARDGAPFSDDELERMTGLAEQAAVAIANVRLVEDLRAEQGLRQTFAAALADAQERERKRVAEDLHDGPIQELTGLALMLDALRTQAAGARSPLDILAVQDDIARSADAARAVVGGIRRAIYDLHPMTLDELGFSAAVRVVLERQLQQGVDADMSGLDAADTLPLEARTSAFRIVQEAIANVGRHAQATQVRVTGHDEGGAVVLEVSDDGIGFDPSRVQTTIREGHLGFAAMRERAMLAGAVLEVDSRPGHGTRVRARFPREAAGTL